MDSPPMLHRVLASPHLSGHFLLFAQPRVAPSTDDASLWRRLAVAAVLLEGTRLAMMRFVGRNDMIPGAAGTLFGPLSLLLAITAMAVLGRTVVAELGLRGWSGWSTTERSYGLQVAALATVIFALMLGVPSSDRFASVFLPYFCFGIYQEMVYRGLLQTALVRRWNAVTGVLVANALYTFGPLHWNYVARPAGDAALLWGATFAIGLYFGLLYHRSGNLTLPAVLHGIGNAFIVARLGGAG